MQGRARDQRDVLDVESVAGHLLEAGSVYAFLAAYRHRLFPAEMCQWPSSGTRWWPSESPHPLR